MDANKLMMLRQVKFTVQRTCYFCLYVRKGSTDFGTCKKHMYYHMKHKERREMSVHSSGNCDKWERDFAVVIGVAWEEFIGVAK
jgi:hypothetical protein